MPVNSRDLARQAIAEGPVICDADARPFVGYRVASDGVIYAVDRALIDDVRDRRNRSREARLAQYIDELRAAEV